MNSEYLPISRRQLLEGTYAAAVAGFLDAFPPQTAFAKAPMLNTQAPYFYRFKLGNFEGTVVSDGTLPLGKPEDKQSVSGHRLGRSPKARSSRL
jgi:hypothetical protein